MYMYSHIMYHFKVSISLTKLNQRFKMYWCTFKIPLFAGKGTAYEMKNISDPDSETPAVVNRVGN